MKAKAISEKTAITLGATGALIVAAATAVAWIYGVVEAAQTPVGTRMDKIEARQDKSEREYNRNMTEIREDLAEIRGALGVPRRARARPGR